MHSYALAALFLAATLLTACWMMGDPGYRMEPVGMEKINQNQWVKKSDGFDLQTNAIGGLTGEWWIDPHLAISTGPKPVTIQSVELQAAKGVYPATIKEESKVIPALSSLTILNLSWRFEEDTPAPGILGDSSRIVFHLKVGNKQQTADIEYKRSK